MSMCPAFVRCLYFANGLGVGGNCGKDMDWIDWTGYGRVKLANDVTYKRCVYLCYTLESLTNYRVVSKLT